MPQPLEELRLALGTPRQIVIVPHQKPDADALGSALGLAGWLGKNGHTARVVSPTDYPAFLAWLPGNGSVLVHDPKRANELAALFAGADYIFCLDFNDLKRAEPLDQYILQSLAKRVLIDHHEAKTDFADYEHWRVSAAATAELIYEFIGLMGGKAQVDQAIAQCLYAGIMTDTGSFKYPATSSHVHRIIAELLDTGIDHTAIHRQIYDTNSESKLKLLGFALANRLHLLRHYRTAYIALGKDDLKKFNYKTGDTEGLVNYALSVEGIVLAALFKEEEGCVKISFRSVGEFSVNEFAKEGFNGGGHKNAAGGKLFADLPTALRQFEAALANHHALKP